jgi:hypothetical protein
MHTIRVVVIRITLVVVPYLAIEMSRRAAPHSSSSLHLHVYECMDAGINRPLPLLMPWPETAHKNRHDGRRRNGTALRYMHLTAREYSSRRFYCCSIPPHVFPFRGIACLVSATYEAGRGPCHLPHAAYPMRQLGSSFLVNLAC